MVRRGFALLLLTVIAVCLVKVGAMIPVEVYDYVLLPDGTPAVGATVRVRGGEDYQVAVTDSSGFYEVTLTVSSVPVNVTVLAVWGNYTGIATGVGEGVIRLDVKLAPGGVPVRWKERTRLEVSLSRSTCSLGEQVTVVGRILPPMSVPVDLVLVKPSGMESRVEVETNETGVFQYDVTVDEVGVWEIYAEFGGSEVYAESRSNTVTLNVKMRMTIDMRAESSEPEVVLIEGTVSPPLAGVKVVINASFDGGEAWLTVAETLTDDEGRYALKMRFAVAGTILLNAYVPDEKGGVRAELKRPVSVEVTTWEVKRLKERLSQLGAEITALREEVEAVRKEADFYRQAVIVGVIAALLVGAGVAYLAIKKLS